jgi:hypothetical protein
MSNKKKHILLFCSLIISLFLKSQTIYSWSGFPSGGTSYNTSVGSCSMAVTTNGSEYNTVGNIPRYTSTGTLPSSNDGRNGLFIDQNWTTQTNTTTVVFTFNPAVNSPNFIIYDINRTNACTVSLSTSSTSLSCLATAQTVTASV